MPTTDKLRGLLSKQERKVPDVVRLKEMNEVRNYNRDQFQKVFDLEKQQVSREKESIQPASAKDVGSAFKLQVYILKLNQILQLKQETYTGLTTSLGGELDLAPEIIAAAAREPPDPAAVKLVKAAQAKKLNSLRGTRGTEATLATQFFSKAELLAAFNEMMAFIKTFMPGLTSDNRQKEQIYSAYLTPLKDQIVTIQGLYPKFFESIPAPREPAAGVRSGEEKQIYELMRQQSMYLYALLGTMAEFLDDENLRPITASDVSLFIRENDTREIFVANPLAGNLQAENVRANIAAGQQEVQAAAAAQQAQQAQLQARQDLQAQQLQEQEQAGIQSAADIAAQQGRTRSAAADLAQAQAQAQRVRRFPGLQSAYPQVLTAREAVESYARQLTGRVPDNQILGVARFPGADKATKINKRNAEIMFVGNGSYSGTQVGAAIIGFTTANPQFAIAPGRPPRQPPIRPGQQQAGPAVDLRAAADQANFETNGQNVARVLGIQDANEIDMLEGLVARARGLETDDRAILKARNAADVQRLVGALSQRRQQQLEDMFPQDQQAQLAFARRAIDGMRQVREAFAGQSGAPDRQRELWGKGLPELKSFVEKKGMFPSKMNPKHVAHFMKAGIEPEMIFKLMKKHNIRDGALMEEMEGSGIFDDIVHYGSKAFDSVKSGAKDVWKGVKDSVKDALPSMSDVRRGIGSIVPDSLQKHMPDSLKQTFGDKAKNFFGFGATEAGGIPDRHREPFSAPNLDKYGYRQGAAQRMRIMPVDMELVSGLHRLRGGDELRDTDVEVMRRKDHHDVDVPVAQQQPIHGYGVDGDEDDQMEGGLKRRLMGMPISMFAPRGGQKGQFIPMFSGAELDPYADKFEGGAEAFYEEEEKPHDHDEDPTPFRVRDENYKVNTGRLKKVTYKE